MCPVNKDNNNASPAPKVRAPYWTTAEEAEEWLQVPDEAKPAFDLRGGCHFVRNLTDEWSDTKPWFKPVLVKYMELLRGEENRTFWNYFVHAGWWFPFDESWLPILPEWLRSDKLWTKLLLSKACSIPLVKATGDDVWMDGLFYMAFLLGPRKGFKQWANVRHMAVKNGRPLSWDMEGDPVVAEGVIVPEARAVVVTVGTVVTEATVATTTSTREWDGLKQQVESQAKEILAQSEEIKMLKSWIGDLEGGLKRLQGNWPQDQNNKKRPRNH
jgi:hypothetical protein